MTIGPSELAGYVHFTCPDCGHESDVPDDVRAHNHECPAAGGTMVEHVLIPDAAPAPPAAPAPAPATVPDTPDDTAVPF